MEIRTPADIEFERLLLSGAPRLRAFARTLDRNPHEAEDLAQAALLKIWKARDSFQPGTNFLGWAFRILRNENVSRIRLARRAGEHTPDGIESLPAPDDQQAALETKDIWRALQELPLMLREALVLVAGAGLSYEAAAQVIGCPVGTVKTRVFRARAALLVLT